jgi:hypothetical protein
VTRTGPNKATNLIISGFNPLLQGELFSVNPAFGEEESPEMRESKRAKSQITSAENPMFGAEGEEGGNVNPMWIAGAQAAGDESPLAPGAVKTREVRWVVFGVGSQGRVSFQQPCWCAGRRE